ncbi:MAG: DUF3105 domain-containing protein [Kofleriaceae bacterium]
MTRPLLLASLALGAAACGQEATPTRVETGVCDGVIATYPTIASPHREEGAAEAWTTNPPTSGPHSPAWAAWDVHHPTLDRVHWVHNLEHGGVVIAYRCDQACPDVVAELATIIDETATDPSCQAPVRHRLLLVADPLLPDGVAVAAVAWGAAFTASCVDADHLRAFIAAHYDDGPESLCADGLPFASEPLPVPTP